MRRLWRALTVVWLAQLMCPNSNSKTSTNHQSLDIKTTPEKQNGNHQKCLRLRDEAGNVLFLIVLYCLQGVPLGLSMGSMPFLLQAHSSYTSIGLFSIAAYPYSCKLLWSPVVDSIFSQRFGRRKSWIVPIQAMSSIVLILFADAAESALLSSNILQLSLLFFVLVLLAATQDIAVDGWALTLLSRSNLGYTSTCQTVGMNAGFFLSFTVFLAFNDRDFSNRYFRTVPQETGLVSLSSYMKWWGVIYAVITLYIALVKTEKDVSPGTNQNLRQSYSQLWSVVRLPAVLKLASVLLLCRIGSLVAEGAGTLKLLEKGVSKEALAGIVLLEFPIELFSAVLAGKWVSGDDVFSPFVMAYRARLVVAAMMTYLVFVFPAGVAQWTDNPLAFVAILGLGVATSFVSTLMFTAQGAFFSQISDPAMGGAYLTLLNALSNLGSSLPRLIVFWLMDQLTVRECRLEDAWMSHLVCPSKKDDALESNPCTDVGGTCVITKDGFFPLSYSLILMGFVLGVFFSRTLSVLQKLPISKWHVNKHPKET